MSFGPENPDPTHTSWIAPSIRLRLSPGSWGVPSEEPRMRILLEGPYGQVLSRNPLKVVGDVTAKPGTALPSVWTALIYLLLGLCLYIALLFRANRHDTDVSFGRMDAQLSPILAMERSFIRFPRPSYYGALRLLPQCSLSCHGFGSHVTSMRRF